MDQDQDLTALDTERLCDATEQAVELMWEDLPAAKWLEHRHALALVLEATRRLRKAS
jgi:hypothetical protein